jgi:hypothetical protein
MNKATSNGQSTRRIGKGTRIPFPIAAVCWVDLLGYGSAMSAAAFNPLHPAAKAAINRLRRFHRIVSEHSARHFPTLVMNDGAAAYRDLSLRTNSVTHDFLSRAWALHSAIVAAESRTGDPGARMVVATGFRMLGRRAGLDERGRQVRSIIERLEEGEITAGQAIAEGERLRTTFDVVPQLQANFAFTKAYLAEQSGTEGGLPGPHCYVDMAMFSGTVPFLTLGKTRAWKHPTLAIRAQFAPIADLKDYRGADPPPSIRSGLDVGIHLTDDPDLLASLREATKS